LRDLVISRFWNWDLGQALGVRQTLGAAVTNE
jgi:hypothetical protein